MGFPAQTRGENVGLYSMERNLLAGLRLRGGLTVGALGDKYRTGALKLARERDWIAIEKFNIQA